MEKENIGQKPKYSIHDVRRPLLWLYLLPTIMFAVFLRFEFPIENIGLSFVGGLIVGCTIATMICIKIQSLYDIAKSEDIAKLEK